MKKYLFTNNRRKEKKIIIYWKAIVSTFQFNIPFPCKIGFFEKNYSNAKIENMNPVNRYYVNQDNDVHSACLKIE